MSPKLESLWGGVAEQVFHVLLALPSLPKVELTNKDLKLTLYLEHFLQANKKQQKPGGIVCYVYLRQTRRAPSLREIRVAECHGKIMIWNKKKLVVILKMTISIVGNLRDKPKTNILHTHS